MRIIPKILIAAVPLLGACGAADDAGGERPTIAVTTTVLASIVSELVGDAARVVAIIPDGTDPHDFSPSAKDVETLNTAALVVANGLDLEEGLEDVLENVSADRVFFAADHVTTRSLEDDDHENDDEDTDDEHGHNGLDPHIWLSPFTVSEFVPALATALGAAVGGDFASAADELVAELLKLDTDIAARVNALVACELVTGHDELGYFADRYGCDVIGTVIPSSTTSAEATAKQLADLKNVIDEHDVRAIFTGVGTPKKVADQIAKETGVQLVELATHVVGDSENYDQFMRGVADTIVDALS
jgi:zinc/manganese transport system substrate-binding protein